MLNNLDNYVKTYNMIDSDICDLTVSTLNNLEFKTHTFYFEDTKEYRSHDNEPSTYYATGQEIMHNAIMSHSWNAIKQYVQELDMSWFNTWQGYSYPKYNRYSTGNAMKEHCDHIKDTFDGNRKGIPILTILGVLNDNYQGGELVLFQDKVYPLKKGDIIIFPSNFLYPHRIDPVTSGDRYSFASWVW